MLRMGLTAPMGGADAYTSSDGSPLKDDEHRRFMQFATHLSMDLILEQFWALCMTGMHCDVRSSGPALYGAHYVFMQIGDPL